MPRRASCARPARRVEVFRDGLGVQGKRHRLLLLDDQPFGGVRVLRGKRQAAPAALAGHAEDEQDAIARARAVRAEVPDFLGVDDHPRFLKQLAGRRLLPGLADVDEPARQGQLPDRGRDGPADDQEPAINREQANRHRDRVEVTEVAAAGALPGPARLRRKSGPAPGTVGVLLHGRSSAGRLCSWRGSGMPARTPVDLPSRRTWAPLTKRWRTPSAYWCGLSKLALSRNFTGSKTTTSAT